MSLTKVKSGRKFLNDIKECDSSCIFFRMPGGLAGFWPVRHHSYAPWSLLASSYGNYRDWVPFDDLRTGPRPIGSSPGRHSSALHSASNQDPVSLCRRSAAASSCWQTVALVRRCCTVSFSSAYCSGCCGLFVFRELRTSSKTHGTYATYSGRSLSRWRTLCWPCRASTNIAHPVLVEDSGFAYPVPWLPACSAGCDGRVGTWFIQLHHPPAVR